MISPEFLKRFPFFAPFSEGQLREIAMIAEEISFDQGVLIFEECKPAEALYLLAEGGVELFYTSEEKYHAKTRKELPAGDINPGEVFSISALIAPYVLNASGHTTQPSRLIKFDAKALRGMAEKDMTLGYQLMQQITKALMERLIYTRVQLAAAWA